jgi:Ankyrin repeats (3 copies)
MVISRTRTSDVMHAQKPHVFTDRLKVIGALGIALGIPLLMFLGFSTLPILVRGNQDLYDAIERHDLSQVQLLLRQGADANSTSRGWQFFNPHDRHQRRRRFAVPPLIRALQLDAPEIAVALVSAGADVNARDEAGTPALMLAAQRGQAALVRLLLERGADVRATDREGNTVLGLKASTRDGRPLLPPEVRELLLKSGGARLTP